MTTPSTSPSPAWSLSLFHHDLVPLGDDLIEVCVAGPPRTSSTTPLVIIEAGHGATLYEWVVAQRHISTFARCLIYSRAGYGRSISGPSPAPRTAKNISHDLHALLTSIGLPPPYVLVGHSYGGNIVRTFLDLYQQDVAGMVLVDSFCVYDPPLPEGLNELLGPGGMDTYNEVLGFEEHHVFAPDEWGRQKKMGSTGGSEAAAGREGQQFEASVQVVNEAQGLERGADGEWRFSKQQLGAGRLSVLLGSVHHDMSRLLTNAEEKGFGTPEARNTMVEWLEQTGKLEVGNKTCALSLSSASRLVRTDGWARTHNLHWVRPDLVAEQVKWVMKLDGGEVVNVM